MKLLRLRVKDFRGVAEREVSFLPRGVTVIEGPNESGKTSLADAIDLIFDKRASSTDRAVRSVQPVGRDVGSEVEVEVETGPYRFVFFKRFNKQHETVLRVHDPSPEDHSGREAHERAREILEETVDLDLWRALRVKQGNTFAQPEIGASRSLLASLEGASHGVGGEGEGVETESLFERIRETRELYFTAKAGRPTGELRDARLALEEAESNLAEVEAEYRRLEVDVERETDLADSRSTLREDLERAAAREREATEAKAEVDRLLAEVAEHKAALADERGKVELLRELVEAEGQRREMERDLKTSRAELAAALEAEKPIRAAHEAAAESASAAEATYAVGRQRLENRRRREELERRLRRYSARSQRLGVVDEALAGSSLTREALERLEGISREVDRKEAELGAVSATLHITAHEALDLQVGDATRSVRADDQAEIRIDRPVSLDLPALHLVLRPGRDPEGLRRRLEELEREIEEGCRAAGVENVAAASESFIRRQELEAERLRLRQEAAGEEPFEALEKELSQLLAADDDEGALQDPEALEKRLQTARGQLATRRQAATEAARAVAAARRLVRDLEIKAENGAERSARARALIGNLVEALAGDASAGGGPGQLDLFQAATRRSEGEGDQEESVADETSAFARALAEARRREDEARVRFASVEESLASTRPEAVRRRAETAMAQAEVLRRRLNSTEGELRELRGRLAAHRERDLFEGRQEARSRAEAARRAAQAVERRARAAERLWQAFGKARDAARETYSEPLRRHIEDLGRDLFGETFAVELDDELRIARRILLGEVLEVERLSAGTREQLALLSRLASAMVAARPATAASEGVPLIIDDALGSADPKRLAAMERVIERVGGHGQIILLTCFPERYRGILGASLVTFSKAPSGTL